MFWLSVLAAWTFKRSNLSYLANFYDANDDVLVNAGVTFTLDPGAFGLTDGIGGWNAGAYGKAELALPGSLSRVVRIGFVRAF